MNIIIVGGITGIDKHNFIENFIVKAGIKEKSEVIDFEIELTNPKRKSASVHPPTTITSFLDKKNPKEKAIDIEQTFDWISKRQIKNGIEYVFLDIHLTYYWKTEYFPPLNPSNFVGWIDAIDRDANITILNLIDDVFNIWNIIKKKEEEFPNTKLTLREILGWRSIEQLQSESLHFILNSSPVGKKTVKSFMVSVRHPFSTFRNLIIPKIPITMYLSYPISKTRKRPSQMAEINEFRKKMHEIGAKNEVAVFDPVTIDELILDQASSIGSIVKVDKKKRWILDYSNILIDDKTKTLEFPKKEIEESKAFIKHQVRSRDFKLVESADLLSVYRPLFGGPSEGVKAEIDYAKQIGNEIIIYSPSTDKAPKSGNPFASDTTPINNPKAFYQRVDQKLRSIKKKVI